MTTTTIEQQIAQTIMDDISRAIRAAGMTWSPRIRQAAGGDHARIYTGQGGEHLRVYRDGRVERSKARMSWGHIIDSVLDADPMSDETTVIATRIENRSRWETTVVVSLSTGEEVWMRAGVPESDRGTAEAAGSAEGLIEAWPYGEQLDHWCPASLQGDAAFLDGSSALREAVDAAARGAY